ncbi:ribbon-helix-helix protein, CopG family [Corynebacterium xerosis]|uniref:ribbon-helix-helix protein, CopG family n=1 Tax=Corynebacterium xerosis TaxID=1725 RepID=UPI00366B18CA
MATKKQRKGVSDRVVSVRLPEKTIERIDALAERTKRSRGVYLRMMIHTMLPHVEDRHWSQVTADVEDDVLEERFREIIAGLDSD